MTVERIVGIVIAACLIGYLVLARRYPEKF
ncbi:K(+)-transporting ATPase subunit F [Streptomyces sp. ODS28]